MTAERMEHVRLFHAHGLALLPLHFPFERWGEVVCSCVRETCAQGGKHPYGHLVRNGLHDASRDWTQLEGWFANSCFNIGIVTGSASGVAAVDVDPRHGGDDTLARLEAEHGTLPPTWRFLTGGGGEHILFLHPGRRVANSAGVLGPGLDVRGDGGMIVAPPSRHMSGRAYAISVDHHPDDVALAPMPGWLAAKIVAVDPAGARSGTGAANKRSTDWRAHVGAEHSEGKRNHAVAKLAGHLLRTRLDPHVVLALVQCWNRSHCAPPLTESEVASTVRSIAGRELERRERRHA